MDNLKGSIKGFNVYHTDAYMIAVRNGFEGTEAEWLESLKGEPGYTPKKGVDYFDGEKPVKGVDYFTEAEINDVAEQAASMMDEVLLGVIGSGEV